MKREGVDFLLAVGGGSVIDGTKFVALAARYEGVGADGISDVVEQLKAHGLMSLSETGDITPEVSRKILEHSL